VYMHCCLTCESNNGLSAICSDYYIGACEASRFDWNLNAVRFKSDGLIRNFELAAHAVVPQTTLTVQQKISTIAPL